MSSSSLRRRGAPAGLLAGLVLALGAGAPARSDAATAALGRAAAHPDRAVGVIVQVRPSAPLATGRRLVRRAGGRVTSRPLSVIHGFGARLTPRAAHQLSGDRAIRAVSLDGTVHSRSVATSGIATAYPFAVQADKAWNASGATGDGVGVAVIDTGIDGDLPDFRRSRSDGTSRVVASVVTNPGATSAADGYGHGTHVAGIIAGDSSARPSGDALAGRYTGVAPDANLVSIKVSDDHGATSVLDVIYGIQFAIDHKDQYGIRVINMSLSSSVAESAGTDPLDAAAESAWLHGIVVVAAAGNSGTASDAVSYAPANDPYVITVGAVDDQGTNDPSDDVLANWSSRGKTQDGYGKPDVVAPGAHIVSTLAPGSDFAAQCADCVTDGGYFQVGGTSMAAAVVSGAVADVLDKHPSWTPNTVKGVLTAVARSVAGGKELQLKNALAMNDTLAKLAAANRGLTPSTLVDTGSGDVDYTRASWRRASWRDAGGSSLEAGWAAASWHCDCSLQGDGSVDPAAASWRAASWRRTTDFAK